MTSGAETRRIRVLLVTHSLTGGGAERFTSILASHLDRRRFEPAVCSVSSGASYSLPPDVVVHPLGHQGLHHLPRTLWRLRGVLRRERPDVVLSNVLSTNCLTGAVLRQVPAPPPWIARVGLAPEHGEPSFQRAWARRCYPRARVIVSNSQRMLPSFQEVYPGLADRCRTLPNPTDFERLERLAKETPEALMAPPGDGGHTLLAVGRLVPQKRIDLMLRALARVRRDFGVRLWLCGDGPLRPRVEGWITELGLDGAVDLLGFQDNPFALARQADLFVLTSDYEGLPNALIEAQGLGLAAVATRCPYGPDEIVDDGETGVLVPTGDSEALARAIIQTLGDSERRRSMAALAAKRARAKFAVDRVLPRWEALIEELAC